MSSKNNYIRKFVILQGRKTSYSDSNKTKGHVKIEVRDNKAKIAFNVEGLKHINDGDKIYRVYLVRKEQDKAIRAEIGALDINKNGHTKIEWKVNPKSIGNLGIPLEKFQYIIVTLSTFGEDEKELIIPLAGLIEERAGDIEGMLNSLKFREKEAEIKEKFYENKDKLKKVSIGALEKHTDTEDMQDNVTQIESIEKIEVKKEDTEKTQDEMKLDYKEEEIKEYEEIEKTDEEPEEKVQQMTLMKEIEEDPEDFKQREEFEQKQENEQGEFQKQQYEEQQKDEEQKDKHEQQDYEQQEYAKISQNNNEYIKIQDKYEDYFTNEEYKEQHKEKLDWFNSDFTTPYGYSLNKDFNNENRSKIYNYQITNYTLNILKFFEKIEPFKNKLKGYKFWEIEYDENNFYKGFLPYYDYVVSMYYPYPSVQRTTTCQNLIKKYKHYIFGIVMENEQPKYYIYGIPGKFKSSEHPYRGSTGFTTWLQGKNYENDKLGYWLLHIDTSAGRVTSPLTTTRPR